MVRADGVNAEYMEAGGSGILIWLRDILNAILELEANQEFLKRGIMVSVYKLS